MLSWLISGKTENGHIPGPENRPPARDGNWFAGPNTLCTARERVAPTAFGNLGRKRSVSTPDLSYNLDST